jgi:hypothetical protein
MDGANRRDEMIKKLSQPEARDYIVRQAKLAARDGRGINLVDANGCCRMDAVGRMSKTDSDTVSAVLSDMVLRGELQEWINGYYQLSGSAK